MRPSRANVEAGAAHDGVAIGTAGAAGAADVVETAIVEIATAVPVVLAVIQVDPQRSSRGNNGTSSSGGGSGGGSCNTPPGRCWRCRRRGHKRVECTTKEIGFVTRCARCSGFGHEESACPSDATVLAMELPVGDSKEENVLAANAADKCNLRIGEEVRDGELDKQVAQYIADRGATCHMTPDADGSTNYRECSRPLGLTDRRKNAILP